MIRLLIFLSLFFGMLETLYAQQNNSGLYYANEQLSDRVRENRAFDLMLRLRCIQCQGQSIADSDAPIAQAMRHQVRLQIEDGKSNDEIKNWMIARYGEYVSFEPPSSGVSLLLWTAPLVIFLLAIILVFPLFRGKNNKQEDQESTSL